MNNTMADFNMKVAVMIVRSVLIALLLAGSTWSTNDFQNNVEEDQSASHQNTQASDLTEHHREVAEPESKIMAEEKDSTDENRIFFGTSAFQLLRDPAKHLKHKRRHGKQRRKRQLNYSQHSEGHPRKSCKTKSAFVFHSEATDIFGNTVMLHPSIHEGGIAVDQYFYETFCDKEACECSGVDKDNYRSACETTHSFTYARVIKQGEIGWTQIMVRSGCSCVIHKRRPKNRLINIMDAI